MKDDLIGAMAAIESARVKPYFKPELTLDEAIQQIESANPNKEGKDENTRTS